MIVETMTWEEVRCEIFSEFGEVLETMSIKAAKNENKYRRAAIKD